MARIIELILSNRKDGKGVEDDPVRMIEQLYTKSGVLIAEYDSWTKKSWFIPSTEI